MDTEEKIVLGPPKKKKSKKVDDSIIKLLYKIDVKPITSDEFRVNIWTKYTDEHRVVPSTKIASSFFVELLPNGEIIDRTINA